MTFIEDDNRVLQERGGVFQYNRVENIVVGHQVESCSIFNPLGVIIGANRMWLELLGLSLENFTIEHRPTEMFVK